MAVQTNTNNMGKAQGMKKYLKNVRAELKKVIWPSREELTSYTAVVLVTCALAGFGIWVVDTLFGKLLKLIIN
jgi:preprotein translocase subunit SecE